MLCMERLSPNPMIGCEPAMLYKDGLISRVWLHQSLHLLLHLGHLAVTFSFPSDLQILPLPKVRLAIESGDSADSNI